MAIRLNNVTLSIMYMYVQVYSMKYSIVRKCTTLYNHYRDQRARYHEIRDKAEVDPSIMSIIIDGMDQSATHLPHLKKISKSSVNLWHLRTHFTGAIVHGKGSSGYLDFLQYPHDPNLTINVLLRILVDRFKEMSPTGLPERLYVQMDNCARENKNQMVFGFMGLLVEQDIFTEVFILSVLHNVQVSA